MSLKKGILFSLLTTLFCFSSAHADYVPLPEWFVGLQGGYANTNFGTGSVIASPINGSVPITSANIGNHVVAARGYAGYRWNKFFSAELGYLRVANTRYNNINNSTIPDGSISEFAIDLRGKLFFPIPNTHFNPYVQLGAAYMDVNSHGGIVNNSSHPYGYSTNPVFGAGLGYDFLPWLTGDISWTSITGRNTNVPRIDLFMLGLTYRFAGTDAGNRALTDDKRVFDPSI